MTTAAAIAVDEAEVIAFLQRLVRARSVHEPDTGGTEAAAAEVVAEQMRQFGWAPEIAEVAPGRPNVIAVVEGGAGEGPTLGFEGHTDVVTEGPPAAWSVAPFSAEIRDGRLYGRGAADMKAGVAAMLFGVRALQLAGPFPGRIVLLVLVDEEGMMLGAKHFAATPLAAELDACIVCEPEGDEVCTSAKGAVRIGIELRGAMAHGAMPLQGRNPVAAMGEVLRAVAELQSELDERHVVHRHLGGVYVTPTVASAGDPDQINVIPARGRLALDVRTIPGVDHPALVADLRARVADAAAAFGVETELTVIEDRPAVEIDEAHPVVAAVRAAHERVRGTRAEIGGVPGATDGTILTRDAAIPTVVYGPGGKWIAHQVDEYVEVGALAPYARAYAEAARIFLGPS